MSEKLPVLIVEDDRIVGESLSRFLTSKGYEVDLAGNGREGLDLVRERKYSAVIADIMMPEMNGITFLEHCKAEFPDIEVVMMTGYADIKVAIEAMKKGAADFLTKPFRFDHVEAVLRSLVGSNGNGNGSETVVAVKSDNNGESAVRELNRRLERKVQELSILYSISESMDSVEDADTLFSSLVELALTITGAAGAAFYLNDHDTGRFYLKSWFDNERQVTRRRNISFPSGVLDAVGKNRAPVKFYDPYGVSVYCPYSESCQDKVYSLMLAPLYVKTERFGILAVENKVNEVQFNANDLTFLKLLINKAAIALENNALYETLYNNLVATLRSLVVTLEAKDPYTQLHSDRVTKISIQIARVMGCSDEEVETISFAGLLHDIGKIGISDAILQKKGRLTDEEYIAIKAHPEIGAKILEPMGMLPQEKAIIRHHHERWDGLGYPDKLAGTNIPFLARIVSLADAYDAMTSNRVYRKALPHHVALEEIKRNAWYQFDGNIVKAFVALCEEKGDNILDTQMSE